jgi:hypothetical protein
MKFRKNIMWNVGCKIFMKVAIWKTKKKGSKWKAKEGGGGGGGGLILKRILDEIKIRWKKVENLRIMINDTKARNGKN